MKGTGVRRRRVGVLLCGLLGLCATARAHDCLPVPDPGLRVIDDRLWSDPAAADALARERLASPLTPFIAAQLHAIRGAAADLMEDPATSSAEATAALAALKGLPPSPDVNRLRWRVELLQAMAQPTPRPAIDRVIAETAPESYERACAMTVRVEAVLNDDFAQAAGDATSVIALARRRGWDLPLMTADYNLAVIYVRVDMGEAALERIDEAMAISRQRHFDLLTGVYLDLKARVLAKLHRFAAARDALTEAMQPRYFTQKRDRAWVETSLCGVLTEMKDLSGAGQVCARALADSEGLDDMVRARVELYLARLKLAAGEPQEAEHLLDALIGSRLKTLAAHWQTEAYQARAQARLARGDHAGAASDLVAAFERDREAQTSRQSMAGAAAAAAARLADLDARNRLLEETLSHQEFQRRVWIGIAVAAVIAAVLLGVWLRASRLHAATLRRQQAVLVTAADMAPDPLVLLDAEGVVRYASRAPFAGCPRPRDGQPLREAVPGPAAEAVDALLKVVMGSRARSAASLSMEAADGTHHYTLRAAPVFDGERLLGATLLVADVTELRDLEREVLEVASRERLNLSSELHDDLGQILAGIALLAGTLSGLKAGDDTSTELAGDIRQYANEAVAKARDIARGLSPLSVVRGSLRHALERLAGDASRRFRAVVSVDWTAGPVDASDAAADHLYRIVDEAVLNAARHGHAEHTTVTVAREGADLSIEVRDDGAGAAAGGSDGAGLGLRLMDYRARLLGGTFRAAVATEGPGFVVRVRVPLARIVSGPRAEAAVA